MYLEELPGVGRLDGRSSAWTARLDREDGIGWLKTIAGLANAAGGDFYLGAEEETGRLTGYDRVSADRERSCLSEQIRAHLAPEPRTEISFLRYREQGSERFVLRIRVEESAVKPVILNWHDLSAIVVRRDGFTGGATWEEIRDMSLRSRDTPFDTLPSGVPYLPQEFTALRACYAEYHGDRQLEDETLRSMGFYDGDGILANGAALFADGYRGGRTEVLCTSCSGFHRESGPPVAVRRYDGNLLSTIRSAVEFVAQRMNRTIIKRADFHETIDAYPPRSLFEGIVLAAAHRDYFLDGEPVRVELFRDRLEITAPGALRRGERPGKTRDLAGIVPEGRNKLITAVLACCGLPGADGAGFGGIAEAYAKADTAHRPYLSVSSDHFTLVLPDLTFPEGVREGECPAIRFVPVANGTRHDEQVLSYCYDRARRVSDIAGHLGLSDSTFLRREILGNLVAQGYLEKDRVARTAWYKTRRELVELA